MYKGKRDGVMKFRRVAHVPAWFMRSRDECDIDENHLSIRITLKNRNHNKKNTENIYKKKLSDSKIVNMRESVKNENS